MMLTSFLASFAVLIGYFVACALTAIVIRHLVRIPEEVFRKTLHLILLGSLPVFLYSFEYWWMAAGASLVLFRQPRALAVGTSFPARGKSVPAGRSPSYSSSPELRLGRLGPPRSSPPRSSRVPSQEAPMTRPLVA